MDRDIFTRRPYRKESVMAKTYIVTTSATIFYQYKVEANTAEEAEDNFWIGGYDPSHIETVDERDEEVVDVYEKGTEDA